MQKIPTQPVAWPQHPEEKALPHHEMVWVAGGSFLMGNDDEDAYGDEEVIHRVTIKPFFMARFPVTQALYLAVLGGENPAAFVGADRPVEQVSWDDAQTFIKKLNEKTGRTQADWRYALPSEAQWEYAARSGEDFKYAGSDKLKEVGWFDLNSHGETKPIGLKLPNALGLYDMSGNVWEWCEDDWHDSYDLAPDDGSAWVDAPRGSLRVSRGGSWNYAQLFCRVSYRYYWYPDHRYDYIGFRLCLAFSSADG